MKAFLMHPDRDFDLEAVLPKNSDALIQDLELAVLFSAMAQGDKYLYEIAAKAVLRSLPDQDAVRYRQNVLRDVIANAILIREIYELSVEALENERKAHSWAYTKSPSSILGRAVEVLQMYVRLLKQLRGVGTYNANRFSSEGFTKFFTMLDKELSDDYFLKIEEHLTRLKFPGGVWVSAALGEGNKGIDYTLRWPNDPQGTWISRLMGPQAPAYTWHLPIRDEAGANALGELRDRGLNLVANALAQADDHILSFFAMLRAELAFYVGCLNLQEQLTKKVQPFCFPVLSAPEERKLTFSGLYDVCLAFKADHHVVGNDLKADGKDFVVITGANTGGKTTFLRSLGLSHLMMKCGMFVSAEAFGANMFSHLFTHYVREEDTTMKSGKLDEELSRFSGVVDQIERNAIVMFNESFSATNEREGSEIARQVTAALLDKRVKVFFVTHLYDFADSIYKNNSGTAAFLRAERQADGARTFKLIEAEPLPTGYGEDLYREIFGEEKAAEDPEVGTSLTLSER